MTMEVIEHDIANLNVENIKTTLDVNDVRVETKDAVDHIVMTDNNGVSITNVTGSRTDVALKADSSVDGSNIIINATNVDINIVDK